MKLYFVAVSGRLPKWLQELTDEYEKKISYWLPAELTLIESPSLDRSAQDKKIKTESDLLLKFFRPDDFIILCEERSDEWSSEGFAKRLERIMGSGKKRLLVVIGGSYGVNDEVKKRADLQMCLSQFTMNHHLALAVVCEQVYRAMTILKGTKYHNA